MHLIFGFFLLTPLHAQTLVLKPLPSVRMPIFNAQQAPVDCTNLSSRIQKYSGNVRLHEQSLISFLNDVSSTSQNWYTQLVPLEGKTETIPPGTFTVINNGSNDIQNVTEMAAENSNYLDSDLDQILSAIATCVKTSQPPKSKRR